MLLITRPILFLFITEILQNKYTQQSAECNDDNTDALKSKLDALTVQQ